MIRLVIFGSGKYGRVIEDVALQTGQYDRVDFLDDYANSSRVIGRCSDFARLMSEDTGFFVAFGDNDLRAYWMEALHKAQANVCLLYTSVGRFKIMAMKYPWMTKGVLAIRCV